MKTDPDCGMEIGEVLKASGELLKGIIDKLEM
jgi:hypothetical protein